MSEKLSSIGVTNGVEARFSREIRALFVRCHEPPASSATAWISINVTSFTKRLGMKK